MSFPKTLDLASRNMISGLIIVLSRNELSLDRKVQELDQKDLHTETLYLDGQSITYILMVVLSRNSISLEIEIQGLDQNNRHSKKLLI